MTRRRSALAAGLVWLSIVATALAESDVLSVAPENAVGLVAINKLASTSRGIEKLAARLGIPAPAALSVIKTMTGIHEGLDEQGSAAVVWLPADDAEAPPVGVLLIPVTDYGKFLAQLQPDDADAKLAKVQLVGVEFVVCHKGSFAVLAPTADRAACERVLQSDKNLASVAAPELRIWLNQFAITAVATQSAVKFGAAQAHKGLGQAQAAFPADNPQAQAFGDALKLYSGAVDSIEKNVSTFALGIRVDESGAFHLGSRTLFAPTAKLPADAGKLVRANKLWAGLPKGPYALAFAGPVTESMMSSDLFTGQAFRSSPLFKDLDEKSAKELTEVMQQSLRGIDGVSMVMGLPQEKELFYGRTVAVFKVADAKAFLKNYQQAIEKLSAIAARGGDKKQLYTAKSIDFAGKPGLEIAMNIEALTAGSPPETRGMFDRMFGTDGTMNVYLTAADEQTVVLAYVSKESLQRVWTRLNRRKLRWPPTR